MPKSLTSRLLTGTPAAHDTAGEDSDGVRLKSRLLASVVSNIFDHLKGSHGYLHHHVRHFVFIDIKICKNSYRSIDSRIQGTTKETKYRMKAEIFFI